MLYEGKVPGWNLNECEVNVKQGEKHVYVLNKSNDCEFPEMTEEFEGTMWLSVNTVLNGYEEKSFWCRHPQVKGG